MYQPTRTATLRLPATPRSPARARHMVSRICGERGSELSDTAALLTSEVVTNAVQHVGGTITVEVGWERDTVSVGVADESSTPPVLALRGSDAANGRGLQLLAELATAWGCTQLPDGAGKVVWFEVSDRQL